MRSLSIQQAAEATGWSQRMLRYLEQAGLVAALRTPGGHRIYGPRQIDRLRGLRSLVDSHGLAISDVAFELRMRTEPQLSRAVDEWFGPLHRTAAPAQAGIFRRLPNKIVDPDSASFRTSPIEGEAVTQTLTADSLGSVDEFKVADLSLAGFGRKEIDLAEHEMPGLMSLRKPNTARRSPSRARRSLGSLHMTVQTAVLIETLTALGADVRWVSCNIFSTQDHAAAASGGRAERDRRSTPQGISVFAWKGETLEDYWWCTDVAMLTWPDGSGPDSIVDDGGDATTADPHGYVEYETAGVCPAVPGRTTATSTRSSSRRSCNSLDRGRQDPVQPRMGAEPSSASPRRPRPVCTGSTSSSKAGTLLFPAINVNDSRYQEQVRQQVRRAATPSSTASTAATDVMIGGKVAVVCGYGDVGKGSCRVPPGAGRPRRGHRGRPDLRAAGGDGRPSQVVTLDEDVVAYG